MSLVFDDEEHQALEQCLKPGRPLHGLIAGYRNIVEDPFALDIKLHGLDGFQYVHGTTTLLSAAFDSSSQTVLLYGGTYCGNHYRRQYGQLYVGDLDWIIDAFPLVDAVQGLELIPHYLRSAVLACEDSCYRDGRRGYWLNWLSLSLSQDWHAGCQWLVVDRDHTVSTPRSCGGLGVEIYRTYRRFEILKHERQQADPERWGRPSTDGLERECDLIAIGPAGELLLIDVRDGS